MQKRRVTRSARAATTMAAGLMLAPAVMAMRMPMLAKESRSLDPWRSETLRAVTEKTGALAEGLFAAQLSLAVSASRFWLEAMSGKTPSMLNGVALERAVQAALHPSSKRVRANHRRLSARKG